jgi:hypothetical protein
MPKLVNLLNKNKLTLAVALPENKLDLALAAVSGGAEALMLSFKDDQSGIAEIIKQSKVPVGLSLAPQLAKNAKKLNELAALGADFLTMEINYFIDFASKVKKASRILALNDQFSYDELIELSRLGAEAIDAAIIPVAGAGKEMVIGDLQNYISIVLSAGIPVIIPTQRALRSSEVAIISDTGAKGLLLTPVVTGTSAAHLEKAVREFRLAADDLGN